ncbi:MAG: RIO1 family regulatory kinase/ATPase domain-containing protein [Thermoproteota archaeon]
MSSVEIAVSAIKSLTSPAMKILRIIESGMNRYEYVPIRIVESAIKLSSEKTRILTDLLVKDGLLKAVSSPYRGYALTFSGVDLLALKTLVEENVLSAMGKPVGVGKESEVYDALLENGDVVAIKFHRVGRISFRKTRRLRLYAMGPKAGWITQAKRAASREFMALKKLYDSNVSVPRPIYKTRHVVVMSALDGRPLIEYSKKITHDLVNDVFLNLRKMYEAGVVHADLSEYNILVSEDGHIVLFDFPQWVSPNHKSANRYLSSDLNNLIRFFSKKNIPTPTLSSAISYVKGKKEEMQWS